MASVADIFKQLDAGLQSQKEKLCKEVNGTFLFVVGGTSYGVDIKNAATAGVQSTAPEKADVTITIGEEDFVGLMTGKKSGQSLFMSGKLKVKGAMQLAMKLDKLPKAGGAGAAAAAGAAGDDSAEAVFAGLEQVLKTKPEIVKEVGFVYNFTLKMNDGSSAHWIADLKNGAGAITKNGDAQADVTMSMSEKDFVDLFAGKAKAQSLFMKGALKIKGKMNAAMQLGKLQAAQGK